MQRLVVYVIPHQVFPGIHYNAGEHGYDNEVPEMWAVFMAIGPSFKVSFFLHYEFLFEFSC